MLKAMLILVTHGVRRQLREDLDVSAATVSDALHFNSNSLTSRRVRLLAVNQYRGIYINFKKQ